MLNPQTAQAEIDHTLSLGADFVELFVEKNATNNVSTLSNEVRSVESGINFGIGLRGQMKGKGKGSNLVILVI